MKGETVKTLPSICCPDACMRRCLHRRRFSKGNVTPEASPWARRVPLDSSPTSQRMALTLCAPRSLEWLRTWRKFYKNRSSRKIDYHGLLSREYDFQKTFSLTEIQFSGKTYFYTIHPWAPRRLGFGSGGLSGTCMVPWWAQTWTSWANDSFLHHFCTIGTPHPADHIVSETHQCLGNHDRLECCPRCHCRDCRHCRQCFWVVWIIWLHFGLDFCQPISLQMWRDTFCAMETGRLWSSICSLGVLL